MMKKIVLNMLVLFALGSVNAQSTVKMKDIKLEDNIIYYMDEKQFIIEDRMLLSEVFIKDINTNEIIITMVVREAPSPEGITQYNKDGMDSYYEFTYVKNNFKCDYRCSGIGKKAIAKDMLYYGMFESGVVNEKNVMSFISLKGSPYTSRNNRTVIVVN